MLEKIPQEFIRELVYKTDIVEIISPYLKLKKKGYNFLAHCPFHSEKTPSFTVNLKKQFYYCFGCHEHGNVIDFYMKFHNLKFLEVIKELSIMHGMEVFFNNFFKKKKNKYKKIDILYTITKIACKIYQENLFLNTNKNVLNYFIKRGITENILKHFCIGYSDSNIDFFLSRFLKKKQDINNLLNVGLLIKNNQIFFDRFQERIMFPIRNYYGKITGFGGRVLNDSSPKYINSPETLIFSKKKQLYGLYEVKKKYSFLEYLIIVEGYIDVITLVQFGIYRVVSILGTTISSNHLKTLFRETDTLIYCYDGDISGKKAAWRALTKTLSHLFDGKVVKFIFLPKNEDPDSYIKRYGKCSFKNKIKNSVSLSDFLFYVLLKKINLNSIDERSKLVVRILPLLSKIPSKTTQILMKQTLLKKLGILETYRFFLEKNKKIILNNNYEKKFLKHTTLRILIGLLVQNPCLSILVTNMSNLKSKKFLGLSFFLEIVQLCQKNYNMNTGQLIELYRHNTRFAIIKKIAKWNHMIQKKSEKTVFLDALKDLERKILEYDYNILLKKERLHGLEHSEKLALWDLNKKLYMLKK
ncbi:DNA primase [Buchnera aphidicola (Thelaxes californica)]|uniref:DNA primase n=1 Tax=Buchnera aphidicola (Thelaxes californica) TaxID=1315998 RepID=A0A4D6YEX7_9GAMM|nr:DNA primase [Buchnera aphidicola]QCI26603.1 DNA primase [Buchnera aphidicola (Thelaxes californica)]